MFFEVLSDFDVDEANTTLTAFNKNLEWDPAFMMKLISLPFDQLGGASLSFTQKLLDDIREVLNNSLEAPEEEKNRKIYT